MTFELPDAELFKYPAASQGLVIWLLNTRLWKGWFQPITKFTAERYCYRNYPVSVSFAPWWLSDYKPGEFIVWKWCVDQVERAGSTDWITSLLGREEMKRHQERKSFKQVPVTPASTAFSVDSHCHPEHREVLRGIFINKDEVDGECQYYQERCEEEQEKSLGFLPDER